MMGYSLEPISAPCPVCKSIKTELLYEVDSKTSAEHFIRYCGKLVDKGIFLQKIIKKVWGQDTCKVIRCLNCTFCYSLPYVEAGRDFYRQFEYSKKAYPLWRPEYDLTLKVLENKKDFSILEIAAGDGKFIQSVAPALTPLENVLCTEYSEGGMNEICNYGIKCVDTDFRSLEGKFDVICMFQILEHLAGIDKVFDKLNSLSHINTTLFISVPNDKRLEKRELKGGMLDIPPNHIGRWNRKCFNVVTKKHGWNIVKFETPKKESHWIYMEKEK
jgi:hypothetical protein